MSWASPPRGSASDAVSSTVPFRSNRTQRGRSATLEGVPGGDQVLLAESAELPLGARDQPPQLGGVELLVVARHLVQRAPHVELALDAAHQPLELDHAAQRRVAPEAAVQLQPAELLGGPGEAILELVLAGVEAPHDRLERGAVLGDLPGKFLEELAVGRSLVLAGGPAGELEAESRARQMVVQVDRELVACELHGENRVPESGTG